MLLVDPNNPETWRNSSAPPLRKDIADAATRLAGRRPCGCPVIRFAWGQTREQFQRGKMRLLYVDTRIPARERERHTLKKLLYVEKIRVPTATDLSAPGGVLYTEIEKPHYDTRLFRRYEEVPAVLEAGWVYEREPPDLEWIGEQLWYIEQWKPGHLILGGEREWERNRFELWFDPEIGKEVLCDVTGPFPHQGRYETIGVVGEKYLYPIYREEEKFKIDHLRNCPLRDWLPTQGPPSDADAERCLSTCEPVSLGFEKVKSIGEHLKCREPDWDTVEVINKTYQERERQAEMTPEQRGRERFRAYADLVERRAAKGREERRDRFRDDQWKFKSPDRGPLGVEGGGARIYVPNSDAVAPSPLNRKERRARAAKNRKAA
jgi:hypothetical protein